MCAWMKQKQAAIQSYINTHILSLLCCRQIQAINKHLLVQRMLAYVIHQDRIIESEKKKLKILKTTLLPFESQVRRFKKKQNFMSLSLCYFFVFSYKCDTHRWKYHKVMRRSYMIFFFQEELFVNLEGGHA